MTSSSYFQQSVQTITDFIAQSQAKLEEVSKLCIQTIAQGNKLMICGNGGSAADSQHFAAEIVGTFYNKSRKWLPALALTTDTSIITAVGNDLGYEQIFARQVEWLGQTWDVLIVISTSGNSKNCIQAIHQANKQWNITTIWLLWWTGWLLKDLCDHSLIVPSSDTPQIQQVHLCIYHWICMEIDKHFS